MPNRVFVSVMDETAALMNENNDASAATAVAVQEVWQGAASSFVQSSSASGLLEQAELSEITMTSGESECCLQIEDDISKRISNIQSFLLAVMDYLKINGEEVSVSFCNDKAIKELNKKWRNIDRSTDVLSFEDGDEYIDEDGNKWRVMGDIVISFETLSRSMAEVGEDENAELRRLLVHGLLHLNGYDHGDEHLAKGIEPGSDMLKLQEKILKELNEAGNTSMIEKENRE